MAFSEVPIDRIVRVIATRKDGESCRGTGFRFSSDRVVTAFHVVEGAQEIRVLDPDGKDWKDSGKLGSEDGYGVIWPPKGAHKGLDAAVLSTPDVDGIFQAAFQNEPWPRTYPWECRGFPAAEPEERKGFSGKAFECLPGEGQCQLLVENTFVESIKVLGGLSGAPVFLEVRPGSFFFAGLIYEGSDIAKGSRLRMTALPALLDDESFRVALLGEEPPWFDDYIAMVQEKLEGDQDATNAVRQAFSLSESPEGAIELAETAIREMEDREVCMRLAQAAKALDREGKRKAGDGVREVLAAVAPVHFLRSRGMSAPDSGARRVDLEVATDLGAEAVVAIMRGRLMEVRAIPKDIPEPKWKVPEPGIFGIDPDGSDAVADVAEDLRRLVELVPDSQRPEGAYLMHLAEDFECLPDRLKQQIVSRKDEVGIWEGFAAPAINRRFAMLTNADRYYFLMELKNNVDKREHFLRRLQEDLPALLQVTRRSEEIHHANEEDEQLQSPFEHAFSGELPEDDKE